MVSCDGKCQFKKKAVLKNILSSTSPSSGQTEEHPTSLVSEFHSAVLTLAFPMQELRSLSIWLEDKAYDKN